MKKKKSARRPKTKHTWVAIYLPALPAGAKNPTKGGFATAGKARAHVKRHVRPACLAESKRKKRHWASCGCADEWLVVREDKASKANDFGELLEAAGAKRVYPIEPGQPS